MPLDIGFQAIPKLNQNLTDTEFILVKSPTKLQPRNIEREIHQGTQEG